MTGVHVPPLAFFEEQLDTTLRDIGADAIKTGMLPSQEQVLPYSFSGTGHALPQSPENKKMRNENFYTIGTY